MIGIFLSNVFQTAEKLGLNQRQMLEIIKEIGYGYMLKQNGTKSEKCLTISLK